MALYSLIVLMCH